MADVYNRMVDERLDSYVKQLMEEQSGAASGD